MNSTIINPGTFSEKRETIFSRIWKAIVAGRIERAEIEAAKQLHRSEYKNESFEYVYSRVKDGTIFELNRD